MKTLEISQATVANVVDRGREDAIAPTRPKALDQFHLFLSEQTHFGYPQSIPCAAASSPLDLELRELGFQPELPPAAQRSQQDSILAKRSQPKTLRDSPAMKSAACTEPPFPLSVRQQSHSGPRRSGRIPTVPSAPESSPTSPQLQNPSAVREQTHPGWTDPAACGATPSAPEHQLPAPQIRPEPNPAAPPSRPDSFLAKRSHPTPRPCIQEGPLANGPEAVFPLSLREQSHLGPERSSPTPTEPAASNPSSAAPQLQIPSPMREQTHCAAARPLLTPTPAVRPDRTSNSTVRPVPLPAPAVRAFLTSSPRVRPLPLFSPGALATG